MQELMETLDPTSRFSYKLKYLGLLGAKDLIEIADGVTHSKQLPPNLLAYWPKEMYRVKKILYGNAKGLEANGRIYDAIVEHVQNDGAD